MTLDEDLMEELRQEQAWQRSRIRNTSCADGYCGAEDCARCRPGSYRFAIIDATEDYEAVNLDKCWED
jgi:hypothetical protein